MKTAKKWADIIPECQYKDINEFANIIEAIQLDARKQGMTDAAEIASFLDGDTPSVTSHGRSRLEAKKAILNARDQIK